MNDYTLYHESVANNPALIDALNAVEECSFANPIATIRDIDNRIARINIPSIPDGLDEFLSKDKSIEEPIKLPERTLYTNTSSIVKSRTLKIPLSSQKGFHFHIYAFDGEVVAYTEIISFITKDDVISVSGTVINPRNYAITITHNIDLLITMTAGYDNVSWIIKFNEL